MPPTQNQSIMALSVKANAKFHLIESCLKRKSRIKLLALNREGPAKAHFKALNWATKWILRPKIAREQKQLPTPVKLHLIESCLRIKTIKIVCSLIRPSKSGRGDIRTKKALLRLWIDVFDLSLDQKTYKKARNSPRAKIVVHSWRKFHQHFFSSFFTAVLAPKNFKPKTQLCNFWRQNFVQKICA